MDNGVLISLIVVIPLVSAIIPIITFFISRKKDNNADGMKQGVLQTELKQIQKAIERLDFNIEKMQAVSERVIIVEVGLKSAHKRIDDIDTRCEKRCVGRISKDTGGKK